MNTTELNSFELEAVSGGDLAYDVGRFVRFAFLTGTGNGAIFALADWASTQVLNDARASQ